MSSKLQYDDLLDAPFKYGGKSVEEGYDCWHLAMEVYRRLGIALPEFSYGSNPEDTFLHSLINEERSYHEQIDRPEPYCLVTFTIRGKYTSHIGVVMDDGYTFLHILNGSKVSRERLDSIIWKKRVTGYYRWRGK